MFFETCPPLHVTSEDTREQNSSLNFAKKLRCDWPMVIPYGPYGAISVPTPRSV